MDFRVTHIYREGNQVADFLAFFYIEIVSSLYKSEDCLACQRENILSLLLVIIELIAKSTSGSLGYWFNYF